MVAGCCRFVWTLANIGYPRLSCIKNIDFSPPNCQGDKSTKPCGEVRAPFQVSIGQVSQAMGWTRQLLPGSPWWYILTDFQDFEGLLSSWAHELPINLWGLESERTKSVVVEPERLRRIWHRWIMMDPCATSIASSHHPNPERKKKPFLTVFIWVSGVWVPNLFGSIRGVNIGDFMMFWLRISLIKWMCFFLGLCVLKSIKKKKLWTTLPNSSGSESPRNWPKTSRNVGTAGRAGTRQVCRICCRMRRPSQQPWRLCRSSQDSLGWRRIDGKPQSNHPLIQITLW